MSKDGFPSHAELATHRVRVHGFVDDAVEYWRTNKGMCPFCLCIVREGSGHNGSSPHFTARSLKSGRAWASCHRAYTAWVAQGGALPLGIVAPSLALAKQTLLVGIHDLEPPAELEARVERWSRAVKEKRGSGGADGRR